MFGYIHTRTYKFNLGYTVLTFSPSTTLQFSITNNDEHKNAKVVSLSWTKNLNTSCMEFINFTHKNLTQINCYYLVLTSNML